MLAFDSWFPSAISLAERFNFGVPTDFCVSDALLFRNFIEIATIVAKRSEMRELGQEPGNLRVPGGIDLCPTG
jgi:hypothetical protein